MLNLIESKKSSFDYGTQIFYSIMLDNEKIGSVVELDYETGEKHVDGIEIVESQRNKGFGTQILENNFSGAYIVPDNADAARLYERIGYEVNTNDEFSSLDQGYGVYKIF